MCFRSKRTKDEQSNKSSVRTIPSSSKIDASQKPPGLPLSSTGPGSTHSTGRSLITAKTQHSSTKTCIAEDEMKKSVEKSVALEVKKKRLEEAQKAMGVDPNSCLLDRLEKEKRERLCSTQEQSSKRRKGDISFYIVTKRPTISAKDDDTVFPTRTRERLDSEEFTEDEKLEGVEEINSDNFMYNFQEIMYTVHDMIRTLALDHMLFDKPEEPKWDRFADLATMQQRPGFDCNALRRNTFVSATTCYRNDDDDKLSRTTQGTTRELHPVFIEEKPRNISELHAAGSREQSAKTQKSLKTREELSLSLKTQETVDSLKSRSRRKRRGRKLPSPSSVTPLSPLSPAKSPDNVRSTKSKTGNSPNTGSPNNN
ncbi:hypothetical protein L596_018341 [Steinernema carpocapsae]|uniref:Uncharacterized protein n=1 Tax=Steinernema carpocapsae TaxID=34508 RepID=A0A4U5N4C5_STECR|nr:hypothetical protein L596_018341 [Steinernema carpocapsae]